MARTVFVDNYDDVLTCSSRAGTHICFINSASSPRVPAPSLVGGWTILYWTSAENTHSLPADSWRNIIQTSFTYMTCYSADKRTHLHMKSNLTTNNNIEARTYLVMFNKQIHSQALKKFFNPNVNKFVQSNTNRGTVLGIILLISENNYQNKQSHCFSR